jgi:pyruvate ferredoxin oxidoreductase alpha subunit
MAEVVFNIAGMRLPVVMTVANRALSAPLSIWNDHQDSMALRDAGWIQLFAQTPQEAHDLHLIAYRVAEDHRVLLPVMVCVDGYVLTHAYEPVSTMTQEATDRFLPAFTPAFALDPASPLTLGAYADASFYEEARYALEAAQQRARIVLMQALTDYADITGRRYEPWFDAYRLEDATVALVAMGTAAQTARVAIDELREQGVDAGLLALRTFRPFPVTEVREALEHMARVVVLDRSVSIGAGGPVALEVRAALLSSAHSPDVTGVIAGPGGRDVSVSTLKRALEATTDSWVDLRAESIEVSP